MNEFTAGSAVITRGSAGSGFTGLYQTSREVTGEIPVVQTMFLLSKSETRVSVQVDRVVDWIIWMNED